MFTENQKKLLYQSLVETNNGDEKVTLKIVMFDTLLGPMIAIGDDNALFLLDFIDRRDLEHNIKKLKKTTKAAIIPGLTDPLVSIQKELADYFAGTITQFKTPLYLFGSTFQQRAWHALTAIPYGHTRSYLEQATAIGNPKAFRAVANANGANNLAIIIPCHRIINTNGKLGGYGGGVDKKQWLLNHEKTIKTQNQQVV